MRRLAVFFRPTAVKLLVFALLATFFLTDSAVFVPAQETQRCPLSTPAGKQTGYPFRYYTHQHLRPAQFSPKHLAFNLAIAYLLACLLTGLGSAVIDTIQKKQPKVAVLLGSLVLNAILAVFVSLSLLGENWLIQALQSQHSRSAKLLLALGVPADSHNETGSTFALWEAVKKRNLELVRLLLDAGATVNARNIHGMTALHLAVQLNQQKIAHYLLQHGADPTLAGKDGRTALHFACSAGSVTLLLKHGADPRLKDRSGRNAAAYINNRTALLKIQAYLAAHPDNRPQQGRQTQNSASAKPPAKNTTQDTIHKTTPPAVSRPVPLKTPTSRIDCSTSVGGSFVSHGKTYQITTDKQGTITVYQGASGFVFANCNKPGYYHLVLEGQNGFRKTYTNLVNTDDKQAPLVFANKQELVLQFPMQAGKGKLHWYFSDSKTTALIEAINRNQVSLIRVSPLSVK